MISSDMFELILNSIGVLAILGVFVFVFGIARMIKNKNKEAECLMSTWDDTFEEPELCEIKGKIIEKHCYTQIKGTKTLQLQKEFYVIFEPQDGETVKYSVDEEVYLEAEENKIGTAAIVGDRFYGFCPD